MKNMNDGKNNNYYQKILGRDGLDISSILKEAHELSRDSNLNLNINKNINIDPTNNG